MSRASWGGQQDLSGMFSGLINENFNDIKAGINQALASANDEQAAADQRMQARWAAGKISDEAWLDYIRERIGESTDPQERSQWQQILLQNQDAISDAQWETRFQQNKITVGQLLAHYRQRMGAVQRNSPAYRELASRNTELLAFQRSGGRYYNDQFGTSGGGGGGGGSSSGGSGGSGGSGEGNGAGSLQGIINKGLKGGPTDVGYLGGEVFNTRGPNVVGVEFGRPATDSRASLFVAVADGLLGSQKQLQGFFDFIEANPKATGYTMPGTGQFLPINAKTVRAADEQWMRVTQTLVNVYHKKGDISESNYQETLLGNHVTTTMRDHNAMFNQSNEDNIGLWTKRVFARLNAASTPEEREKIATESSKQLDQFMERNYPEYVVTRQELQGPGRSYGPNAVNIEDGQMVTRTPTTLEEQLPPEVYESHATLAMILDVVSHPDNYTDEDIDAIFDSALEVVDIGTGAGRIHLADLLGGGGEASTIGFDAYGAGDFREQAIGLKAADLIHRGYVTPDDLPPGTDLYTYQWNSAAKRMEPTIAVATPSPDGSFDVVPGAIDASGNVTPAQNAIKYMSNINGRNVEVWTPVIAAAPASGYVYRFADDMAVKVADGKTVNFKQGDLVPSSALSALGTFNVNAYAQSGRIYKDAPPGIRQAEVAGKTWYFDLRVNTWSPVPPWNIETDQTDPNAIFVLDPDYINGTGGYVVDQTKLQGASSYIAAPLAPGAEGYVMPFDTSMSPKDMQKWLEGEIASGNIVPGEYKFIDADGNAVEMTQDQLMISYFDPAVEAAAQQLRLAKIKTKGNIAIYGTDEAFIPPPTEAELMLQAKQDMYMRQYERSKVVLGPPVPPQMRTTPDPMQAIERAAAGLGIRTGFLPFAGEPPAPKTTSGLDDRLLRTAALVAAQNRERLAREPRLEPLPADPVKPTVKPLKPKPLKPLVAPLTGAKIGKPPPINVLTGVRRSVLEREHDREPTPEQTFGRRLPGSINL